jgi:transposase
MLSILAEQLREIAARVREVEIKLLAWHRANPASRRLESIPGVGPITASAIIATVADPRSSNLGVNLPPGLAWFRNSDRVGERSGLAALANVATVTSAAF